jgi:hypothetical protein
MKKCISSLFMLLFLAISVSSLASAEDVNALDAQGRRTGYWIIKGSMKPTQGYATDQVIEEGGYEANKKQGLWKRYHTNGKLQSEITYQNNIPNGPYNTYYKTGIQMVSAPKPSTSIRMAFEMAPNTTITRTENKSWWWTS